MRIQNNGSFLKNFGIRRKLFLAAILSVFLSIGITTLINSIRFSNRLLSSTQERISQISQSAEVYTLEKINHQLDLLIAISISDTVKEQLRNTNIIYSQLSEEEREDRIKKIDELWGTNDEEASILIDEINNDGSSEYLTRFKAYHSEEVEIFITDKFGQIVSMSNLTSDYWQGDEEWWQKTISGNIYIGQPIYDESAETWALIISAPIYEKDSGSEVIGVVRGTLNITPMFDSIFNPDASEPIVGAFIGNDEKMYFQLDGDLVVEPVPNQLLSFLLSDDAEPILEINDINGFPIIAAKNEVMINGKSLGWVVIYIYKSHVTQLIHDSIFWNLFVGILLIIVLGAISLLFSNSILNVLRNLQNDTSRLSIGDYSYQFSEQLLHSNDPDISDLVLSMEKMKNAIQKRENQIEEREKEYRQLVETMSEGLAVVNPEGFIVYVNPRLCEMLGYASEYIVGKFFIEFYAEDRREIVLQQWSDPSISKRSAYESKLVTSDGKYVYVSASSEPQYDEFGEYTGQLSVITDISKQKQFEFNLQRKLNEISGLREIDTAILEQATYKDVVDTVFKQFQDHLLADGAVIYVVSPIDNEVVFASAYCNDKQFEFEQMEIDYRHLKRISQITEGIQIKKTDDELLILDYLHDKDFRILYAMPIMINNTYHGVAEILYFNDMDLDDEWHNYFNALLTQTAVGISKIQLMEDLCNRNAELKDAYDGILKGWAKALELRDEETKGHSDRVLELSIKMAKQNHYTGREFEAFCRGALLHDIGKMGIPDSILLKPGKLTPEEWDIMKLHPDLAYVLLSEIPFLREAIEIPYYHHERWDGSGYPSGLKGEDIPLAARIFAVVDVWDALTSDRPYRPAWDIEKTKNYMIENKGVQFDPEIVDQLLDLLKEEGIL